MTINERLLKAIEQSGLSYGQIEQITGIPKATLYRYAKGHTQKIPIKAIKDIAAVCGVSASWLMGYEVEMIKKPVDNSTDLGNRFLGLFKQLSNEQQKMIIAQIQGILASQRAESEPQ